MRGRDSRRGDQWVDACVIAAVVDAAGELFHVRPAGGDAVRARGGGCAGADSGRFLGLVAVAGGGCAGEPEVEVDLVAGLSRWNLGSRQRGGEEAELFYRVLAVVVPGGGRVGTIVIRFLGRDGV